MAGAGGQEFTQSRAPAKVCPQAVNLMVVTVELDDSELRRDDRGIPQRELGRSICLPRLASPSRGAVH